MTLVITIFLMVFGKIKLFLLVPFLFLQFPSESFFFAEHKGKYHKNNMIVDCLNTNLRLELPELIAFGSMAGVQYHILACVVQTRFVPSDLTSFTQHPVLTKQYTVRQNYDTSILQKIINSLTHIPVSFYLFENSFWIVRYHATSSTFKELVCYPGASLIVVKTAPVCWKTALKLDNGWIHQFMFVKIMYQWYFFIFKIRRND